MNINGPLGGCMFEFGAKILFVFRIVELERLIEVSDESDREGRFLVAVLFGFWFFLSDLGVFRFIGCVCYFFDKSDIGLRKRAFSRVVHRGCERLLEPWILVSSTVRATMFLGVYLIVLVILVLVMVIRVVIVATVSATVSAASTAKKRAIKCHNWVYT